MEKIVDAHDRSDLAQCLGFKPRALSYILYKIPENQKYVCWELSKKNGGFREIKSPIDQLKLLQQRVSDQLYAVFDEKVLSKNQGRDKQLIHGFIKHRSCLTNARRHVRKRYVFNVDLKDFFPSINFGRVRGYFMTSKLFSLDSSVATTLAQIICYNNELPQGGPSSPIMSNLIASVLDARLVKLAKKLKCTYTRYVDDITFSTNMKSFPKELGKQESDGTWQLGRILRKEIERAGFLYNPKKVSLQYRRSRQVVTGLVVNKSINVPTEYYKNLRAVCKTLFWGGIPYDKVFTASGAVVKSPISIKTIEGRLSYVHHVRGFLKGEDAEFDHESTGIERLYQQFLLYKLFVGNDSPVFIFEGKTDPLYIRYALQTLHENYPKLISVTEEKTEYHIKLYTITKGLQKIFHFPSGSSGLDFLVDYYYKHRKIFASELHRQPVILVYDNDEGAKNIRGKLKGFANIDQKDLNANTFYHLFDNIGVIFSTSKQGETIEDLFPHSLLEVKLEGKPFSKKNEYSQDSFYGKRDFAKKVIGPNRKQIDFNGFKTILDLMQKITEGRS